MEKRSRVGLWWGSKSDSSAFQPAAQSLHQLSYFDSLTFSQINTQVHLATGALRRASKLFRKYSFCVGELNRHWQCHCENCWHSGRNVSVSEQRESVWSGAVRDRGVGPPWERPGDTLLYDTTRRPASRESDCGHLGYDVVHSGWWSTFQSNTLPACSGWKDDGTSIMSTLTLSLLMSYIYIYMCVCVCVYVCVYAATSKARNLTLYIYGWDFYWGFCFLNRAFS
jgi:hypothetical protein